MAEELTLRQREVLEALVDFIENNGFPPTVRELTEIFHFKSTRSIYDVLGVLEKKGYIRKKGKGKSRSIEVLQRGHPLYRKTKSLPIVGKIAAGEPLVAIEDIEDTIELDKEWIGEGDVFLLRVKGQSMIDADIRDGDLLIVEKTSSCQNGDIIIGLLDDEATVKRFYKERDRIRLQPENPNMKPIYISRDDPHFRIIGKVKGLLRRFY